VDTLLLLHHQSDYLTLHHYFLLKQQNIGDNEVRIVPITFPEYAAQALPGSYIATRASTFRINPDPAFHRFSHAGGPLIPDLDCLIWDYVLHSGERADRIILAEGDMLSRCGIREFFGPSFGHAVGGSVVRRGVQGNQNWHWFDKCDSRTRQLLGNNVASISPVCGIHLRWDVAEKIARLLHRSDGLFNNMHVEMAIGTLARLVGEEPMELEVPGGSQPTDFIDWRPQSLKLGAWGIFHPVKTILPEYEEPPAMPRKQRAHLKDWSILEDDYLFLVHFCREHGIRRVLEFGPGDSTAAFLDAGCHVLSFESNAEYLRKAEERFVGENDLELRFCAEDKVPDKDLLPQMPDLIFIDGPPLRAGQEQSRKAACDWALDFDMPILLHDAYRAEEQSTLLVLAAAGCHVEVVPTRKGLALILPPGWAGEAEETADGAQELPDGIT
jgi:hypothetical protein